MDRGAKKGIALISVVIVAMVVMLLVPKQPKKTVHPANDDSWLLVSYDPNNQYGTYLGNGFISTRIMGDGVGSQDGKPLPCFMAGLYNTVGSGVQEQLLPMPTWSDLRFYDGTKRFAIDKSAYYKQTLNMKTGILTTFATWRSGNKTLRGRVEVIVSRANPSVGIVIATLASNFSGRTTVPSPMPKGINEIICKNCPWAVAISYLLLQTEGANLPQQTQVNLNTKQHDLIVQQEPGKTTVVCCISASTIGSERELQTVSGKASTILLKILGSPDRFSQENQNIPTSSLHSAIGKIIADHKAAWAKLWQKDIVIDGPKKDQQALHSCMFYLLQSVREGSQWSIPPMGLSDNAFSGHVFWDADLWMFPALILQHPKLARSIVDYRFNTLPGAMANAKANGFKGAEYAWESGMTGKEDTPPGLVYRYERHIDGDVALAQWQYYLATGDLKWLKTRGYPVLKATADYWLSRVIYNSEMDRYEIKQVVPPDENADRVNNSAYTNAIARLNLSVAYRAAELLGVPGNPKWGRFAYSMYIPFDAKNQRFVAHDGYKGEKTKQADTELLIYPLQTLFPGHDLETVCKNTFDYYANKVMPKGPAMSSSAHSIIAARLKNCNKAYAYFTNSYKPYLRGPFNYFNETPSEFRQSYCFLTGAAGPIQATLFGLAGAHMDYFPTDPSSAELSFKPCLPKQWKSIKITGVQWHGKEFDLSITQGNKVEIHQKPQGAK